MPYTISAHLVCQITQQIFFEPVLDEEGQAFEKEAIYKALEREAINPLTRQSLTKEDLRRARQTESTVEAALKENPEIWESVYFPEETLFKAIIAKDIETVRAIFERERTLSEQAGKVHRFLTQKMDFNTALLPPGFSAYRLIKEQADVALLAFIQPLEQIFLKAVRNNDAIEIRQILETAPEFLHCCDAEGNSVLHLCVIHKAKAVMGLLLVNGADYLKLNAVGKSAFNLMAESNDPVLVNDFAQGLREREETLRLSTIPVAIASSSSSSSSSSIPFLSLSAFFQGSRSILPHNSSASSPAVASLLSHEDLMIKMQTELNVNWDDVLHGVVVEQNLVQLSGIHTAQSGASFRRVGIVESFKLRFANEAEYQTFLQYYRQHFPGFIKEEGAYRSGQLSEVKVDVNILANTVLAKMSESARSNLGLRH